ncbi:MAG: ATP-binding protein [Bacteroidia bacterium]|nr:ATP-binding protein [Bacteroidia bacterium]
MPHSKQLNFCLVLLMSFFFSTSSQAQSTASFQLMSPSHKSCDHISVAVGDFFARNALNSIEANLFVEKFLPIAREQACPSLADILNLKGFQLYQKNELGMAKEVLFEAEKILLKKERVTDAFTVNQRFLGLIYILEHNYDMAILHLKHSKFEAQALKDHPGMVHAGLNIGLAYMKKKDLSKAFESLKSVLKEARLICDLESESYALQNLARVQLDRGEYKDALILAENAEELWKAQNHQQGQVYINYTLSDIHRELNDLDKQIDHLEEAIRISREIDLKINLHQGYYSLGLAFQKTNRLDEAEKMYVQALKMGDGFDEAGIKNVINQLIELYQETRQEQKIKNLYKDLLEIYKIQKGKQEVEIRNKLDKELALYKQKFANQKLQEENNEKQRELQAQYQVFGILSFLILLILIVAFLYYRANKIRAGLIDKIKAQNKRLEQKNEDLKNFAYVASHDLKSPARSILNSAQILEKQMGKELSEKYKLYLDFIKKSSREMHALTSDLLDYAKLESLGLNLQLLDMNSLLGDIVANSREKIEEDGGEIEIEEIPGKILADESKIRQVFTNLINNACKFRKEEEAINIKISYRADENFHFFTVRDNGIGIDPEFHERVFQMFERLHAQESVEGTGIGLAICSKVAKLHGGDIKLISEEGEGASFILKLPKNPAMYS